jgi:hypothetical protein
LIDAAEMLKYEVNGDVRDSTVMQLLTGGGDGRRKDGGGVRRRRGGRGRDESFFFQHAKVNLLQDGKG